MNATSNHGAVRAGTEPATAKSARSLRMRLSLIFGTVFFVLCGLLAWGAAETQEGDTQTSIIALSTACFLAFCYAMGDALRLALAGRHQGQQGQVRPST
ncbi:hypothetical protein [Actinacidiphila rubida]|uniref:Uncharacterized protein n=1 Tax=Actinacidiphila rubida TaxID=310780 RepID=A0A1H8KM34_9ACTN|nr:hypothetical protein [Actinacidiphila rubida]SEN93935.1 hypothetical protein SAMN05216267_101387 [Actinacidiphila rubida]